MRQLRALVLVGAVVLAGQAAAAKSTTPTTYKAKRGDTLIRIAKRFKTTVPALQAANPAVKDPHRIRAGQVLSLLAPKPAPTSTKNTSTKQKPPPALTNEVVVLGGSGVQTYTVAKGDNLSDLAKRFDTTVADLRKRNGLKANKPLQVGKTLTVPGPSWQCPVAGARRFSNDWGAARDGGGRRHLGNDLFAAKGTPVVAPVAGGLELRNGPVGGLAFYLHGTDGVLYYGAHLDAITAKASTLKAGQQIGTVGNTGNAKGGASHLHFEVHPAGHPVNPFPTLSRWC
ncbi:MAG TPA: M23 family metallopeptidase [Acidimicrobiales bacterium]|jgi:murein DD-endopeptidase MepM/ murein hydrolase activator NlpD|nr:M23 family metallopeptidase [Acidimicrobiales bacterium]